MLRARNVSRGVLLGERILPARSHWRRLRGMLGRPEPAEGEGLLLEPCRAVHMYWMRYPLDVVFLDEEGTVIAVYHELQPSRVSGRHPEAARALELRAGSLARSGTRKGDRIELATTDTVT